MIHKRCKLIALLMSVLLLVSVPLFPMHADEEANLLIISDNVAVSSSQVSERQDDPADSNSIINSSSNETQLIIPEIIQDHELCRNFVSRRFEEEKSLYDLVFENEDHTLTSFIYQTPVKYVTEEGDVRDISTELYVISGSVAEPLKKDTNSMQLTKEQASDVLNGIYAKGTVAFGSLDNRVRSWYPENIGDGIGLTDGIYSIRMTPKTDVGLNAKAAADQNSVLYADVFEDNITIRYTPTWNGIKEEIILFSVPEGNSFQFLLNCEGSMIRESEDSIIVTSLETGQTIGSFDPILVYDADGRLTTGSISLQNTDQGQLLTITVDPAFFISAAYPVTIDPSLSFYNVEDGFSWFIQEAGLYSDSGAWGSSFNTMHYVGMNPIDNDYSGRILYRFPVLWDEYYPFHNFYPDQIVSFELHMSTTPSTVSQFCSLYTDFYNSSSWTHGNRICDATAYNNIAWGHYEWTTRSNDDSEITADITQKSKLWISYMRGLTSLSYANPYNGIAVICMQEDTEHCTVKAVSPYGSNLVQTYVTITYRAHSYMGDFYINNLDSRLFWNRMRSTSQGTMTDLGNTVRWTSELVVDGTVPKYAIHPYTDSSFYIGQNGATAYFYDSYCLWRFEEDTYGVKIVNDVTGELLVENSDFPYISTTSTDTGLSCRWRFIRPSAYREVTLSTLAIEELYGQKDIPQSVLPKLIRYNVDFVDAEDFRIDPVDITSATGSVNGMVTGLVETDFQRVSITHIPTGIWKNFSFYTTISDGTYFIKNAETNMFAQLCDSDGPDYSSNNAPIEGWPLDGDSYQRWQFTHLGDGYFKIVSQKSGKVLSVKSGYANSSTESLVQYTYSYENTLQRWKIDWNSSGRFILRPESGEAYTTDWCMCYGSFFSIPHGIAIRQNGYTNDSDLSDEWLLIRMLPTNGCELSYDDSLWSGVPSNNCNCYAYAINNQVKEPLGNQIWFMQQPGAYYNKHRGNASPIPQGFNSQTSLIVSAVTADYNKYNSINGANVTFTPIGRYEVCPSGTYKVALVVSPSDYHWYRQDSDGLWSHKRGTTPVKRTDESGDLIIDPYIADRDSYTTFVGYYAVKPWNNMYVSTKGADFLSIITTDNIIDEVKLSSVTVGMSFDSVIEHIESVGEDIGSGVLIQRYISNNNSAYIFEYESICDMLIVKSIIILNYSRNSSRSV